jgi:aryl-alcohol dehydrogenase-like predicted oxidoreductase
MAEIDHSLRRLGTDHVDLYQVHRNDHSTPLEETLEALHDLVKAGKVRYLGASSMPAWEFAKALHPSTEEADRAIVDAVGRVATAHGATRAQVALAWLRGQPVVTAPIVGAGTTQQIDDAVASLDLELTDEEVRALEAPYTPRHDFQGVSDEAVLQGIMARIPQFTTAA